MRQTWNSDVAGARLRARLLALQSLEFSDDQRSRSVEIARYGLGRRCRIATFQGVEDMRVMANDVLLAQVDRQMIEQWPDL